MNCILFRSGGRRRLARFALAAVVVAFAGLLGVVEPSHAPAEPAQH
jgi:hypothetical protein